MDKTNHPEKMPVTVIQLTDDMKKSVQTDGQALFSLFGLGVGAEMVSDNIQNNIISQNDKLIVINKTSNICFHKIIGI